MKQTVDEEIVDDPGPHVSKDFFAVVKRVWARV